MMASTSAMAQSAVYKSAPMPAFSWTGFYGGVNLGYGFGAKQKESGHQISYANLNSPNDQELSPGGPAWDTSSSLNGMLGGVQLGYNFQANPYWVLGFVGRHPGQRLTQFAPGGVQCNQRPVLSAAGGRLAGVAGGRHG